MNKSPRKFLRLCANAVLLVAVAGLVLVIGRRFFKVAQGDSALAESQSPIVQGESEGEEFERDAYWGPAAGPGSLACRRRPTARRWAQMSRMEAAATTQLRGRALTGAPAMPFSWNFIGPLPMLKNLPNFGGALFTNAPMANSQGRVSAVAADPTTLGRLFVGTVHGGGLDF